MTSTEPLPDPENPERLIGGTAFEHCSQNPVKGSGRCYSLTLTHQRQRLLVGPAAGVKQYEMIDDEANDSQMSTSVDNATNNALNLEIRGKITQVNRVHIYFNSPKILILISYLQINARMAMAALKIGAPEDYMRLLKEHADMVNLP
jgi:hypothetical protein